MQFKLESTETFTTCLDTDGRVVYMPSIFDDATSNRLFEACLNTLDWQPDQLYMFGKKITTQRKVAWVGDQDCSYTYSGVKKYPQPWTADLLWIKNKMEALVQYKFNSCLLNLYHNGSEGMGWHSDDELELDRNAPIVSLSLGAVRKFAFKHKLHKTTHAMFLENGSVLVMYPPTQEFWHHSLLKTKQLVSSRINLTFRCIQLENVD